MRERLLGLLGLPAALTATVTVLLAHPALARMDYVANVDVQRGEASPVEATGVVFHDLSSDGMRHGDEPGVAGVIVTNGRD